MLGTALPAAAPRNAPEPLRPAAGTAQNTSGFEVIDLGIDSQPQKFVAAIEEHRPQALGMSAMLTTTMGNMKVTIDAIVAAGLRDKVKILVGGAPVSQRFANEIGADGYAPDAASAVLKTKEVLKVT